MGYSDIGCYGSEINTPHLDALAANGLRFTQFYNNARCCPTRASLLTGLYPHQAGVGHMMENRGGHSFQGDLSNQAVTIAEVLKSAGYTTYMAGKWHVTPYDPAAVENPKKHNWPRQRGFDRFFGTIKGAGSFYDPSSLTLENDYIAPGEGFYYTNEINDKTVQYIEEHREDNPYFIYVSHTAAHWPMHALPEDIAKYEGRYDAGWEALRRERYERMKTMGLIDASWGLAPRDTTGQAWDETGDLHEWQAARMEVYAAMVDCMDQGIGRIIQALEQKGELDHTLIFFLQDNGGCAEEVGSRRPAFLEKDGTAAPMESGQWQTEMIPPITRDGKPVRRGEGTMPGPADTYIGYGKEWANASNTPFRMYKHWVHEGGIATPLIVHWPERIRQGGTFRKAPSHLIDIMATCVEVGNAKYPSTYNGNAITALEGVSLLPAFDDQPLDREAIYWEHEGNRAVRMGKWKLVSKSSRNSFIWDKTEHLELGNWELFDMEKDRTELNNVAEENRELVGKMASMWTDWANKVGALPRPVSRR